MNALAMPRMTLDEYLAWEERQPTKNEFHRGEVFAMVGARRVHGRVVSNLNHRLHDALRGSPCQVFTAGMKVQVADDTVLYPDLFVTCDRDDLKTDFIFFAPSVVIEVLSPTTERYDRGAKFALYRRIDALRDYVLVDPDTRRVEVFERGNGGDWRFHEAGGDATLSIASIGCRIPLADVFDGIDISGGEAAV